MVGRNRVRRATLRAVRVRHPLLWLLLLGLALPIASRADNCAATISPQIRLLDKKIQEVRRAEPKIGRGPQVAVGSCASRLNKLRGNFLCCKTFANVAPTWEEISCLELKKEYLRAACKCNAQGNAFSEDEALQDQTLEAFSAVRKSEQNAREKGIRNPVIRRIVAEAAKIRDCFSMQTIETLRASKLSIDRLVASEQ